jgi:hypothetical protein
VYAGTLFFPFCSNAASLLFGSGFSPILYFFELPTTVEAVLSTMGGCFVECGFSQKVPVDFCCLRNKKKPSESLQDQRRVDVLCWVELFFFDHLYFTLGCVFYTT